MLVIASLTSECDKSEIGKAASEMIPKLEGQGHL